jgi:hypothetical protein
MIEPLQHLSNQIRTQKLPDYQRFLFRQIDFSQRLIGIMGARGAGKTTLLLQYLKSVARETKVLYVIADHPLVGQHGLFTIADEFQKIGGELLIIDEVEFECYAHSACAITLVSSILHHRLHLCNQHVPESRKMRNSLVENDLADLHAAARGCARRTRDIRRPERSMVVFGDEVFESLQQERGLG